MRIDEAVELLSRARRILILGSPGSGKSTLSQRIAQRFGLKYISMDREFFWLPGWQLRPRDETQGLVTKAIAGDRWLIDGTGLRTLDLRLTRADLVIWLRLPRSLCLWRILQRWRRYIGRSRPEMADDCPERIDLDFLRYIWTFDRLVTPEIAASLEAYRGTLNVLEYDTATDVNALLAELSDKV